MTFIILVALSAFFVAGCAAFFSIKGLVVLFSGSALAIGVMASSLEIGKLVAASFLHTYWKNIKFLLKVYLCSAVIVLMGVTSLGIFGFLTNAYQTHATAVGSFETKIKTLENEKRSIEESIKNNTDRIRMLSDVRTTQEQRVKDAGNYKAPRDQAYKAIAEANEEAQKKETAVTQDRERGVAIDKELGELKISMNTTTDVGSFRFIASALNTDVDTAVQYFIFALIGVFDPLAVTLILALNKLIELRAEKKQQEKQELDDLLTRTIAPRQSISAANKPKTPEVINIPENVVVPPVCSPSETLLAAHCPVIVHASHQDPLWAMEDACVTSSGETKTAQQKEVPLDLVSGVPVAHIDSEESSEEGKRRLLQAGLNDSVIIS
jgi:hypothetical protein